MFVQSSWLSRIKGHKLDSIGPRKQPFSRSMHRREYGRFSVVKTQLIH